MLERPIESFVLAQSPGESRNAEELRHRRRLEERSPPRQSKEMQTGLKSSSRIALTDQRGRKDLAATCKDLILRRRSGDDQCARRP